MHVIYLNEHSLEATAIIKCSVSWVLMSSELDGQAFYANLIKRGKGRDQVK